MISSTFFCWACFMFDLSIALGSYIKETLFCRHFRTFAGPPKAHFDLKNGQNLSVNILSNYIS